MAKENKPLIQEDVILTKIYMVRGQKIMLDRDLAELYEVETKQLKRQTRRNIDRFPEDFMFELTNEEYAYLRSQFGTLKRGSHAKYLPMAFTEQGVAMLSSVLNSDTAIKVNIQIIRIFTKMRQMLETHKEILKKLDVLNRKGIEHDEKIMLIFEYLKKFEEANKQQLEQANRKRIGFKTNKTD